MTVTVEAPSDDFAPPHILLLSAERASGSGPPALRNMRKLHRHMRKLHRHMRKLHRHMQKLHRHMRKLHRHMPEGH